MAVYQITLLGDNILRQKAAAVPQVTPNIVKLLTNLADTMYASKGAGLAAPQIGISKRVIVVDGGEGLIGLVNPVIIESEGTEISMEGCLSIPKIEGEVERAARVVVQGLDRSGTPVTVKAAGLAARALQHEIDHLDGVLFIDRAKRIKRYE